MTRTANDYIFEHPHSKNLFVRLRDERGRRFIKSLGTSDKLTAHVKAADLIRDHQARILAARPRLETVWQHTLEPGREHSAPDGGKIVATEKELIHIGHNGAVTRIEPNGGPRPKMVIDDPLTVHKLAVAFTEYDGPEFGPRTERPAVAKQTSDDKILETYLNHNNITGRFEKEARDVWALYKKLTDNKPLKDAGRDDGRLLVKYFESEEGGKLKSATMQKKIGWLRAAVQLAIDERKDNDPLKLKFNPFSRVVPKKEDKERRLPLDEADIKAIKGALDGLGESDQLLLRVLASTGMRLSEAFEIENEQTEKGVRFVIVGHKTEQSLRRVPFPADLLPHLPKVIKGKLFADDKPEAASKRLNRYLREVGITDPNKVVHSLRHRAKDRLRAAGVDVSKQYEVLGHEDKTVAAGYGKGSPVPMLKTWIDQIGF